MTTPSGHVQASDPVTGLAVRLLARYETAPEIAIRLAYGYANEVWIGENAVVHIKRGTNGGLAREAAITAILPTAVGSPQVLDQGVTGRLEWMVNRRLPGNNLRVEWPNLDATSRAAAVTDLWARLRAVHRTDVAAVRAIGNTTSPFYALEQVTARNLLDELLLNGALRPSLHDRLGVVLGQMFDAVRDVPVVLTHTDAGAHNTVWDGTNAIPVDFETTAIAPPDLDLECIIRTLNLHAGPNPAHILLQEAGDLMSRPGTKDRLLGYAVLRDMWETRSWIGDARNGKLEDREADIDDPTTWRPVRRLHEHVMHTSWMAELLR